MPKPKPTFNPDLKVPFDFRGDLINYTSRDYPNVDLPPIQGDHYGYRRLKEWRDNRPFDASLELVDFHRGRSAAHFIMEDLNGHRYVMFCRLFLEALRAGEMKTGRITGRWAFTKRGANYSIIKIL